MGCGSIGEEIARRSRTWVPGGSRWPHILSDEPEGLSTEFVSCFGALRDVQPCGCGLEKIKKEKSKLFRAHDLV